MKFEEALAAVRNGKKIRRKAELWYNTLITADGREVLIAVYKNGNAGGVALTSRELLAEDWEIFEGWDE